MGYAYGPRRHRGLPWWALQLALLAVAAAVIAGVAIATTAGESSEPATAPAHHHAVLGAQKTLHPAAAKPKAPAQTAKTRAAKPKAPARTRHASASTALLAAKQPQLALYKGKYVRASSARVESVVGPSIFWVEGSSGQRYLVHMHGGATWLVKSGQRLAFAAAVNPNRAARLRAWGLTPREGLREATRQGVHLDVVGRRISFPCVRACRGKPVRP